MLADADLKDAVRSPEPIPPKGCTTFARLLLPHDFPELKLFGLLMWKFGHPNGPMTFLLERREGDPDAPFKWDFLFSPGGALRLQVIRASAGIEVWHWGEAVTESEVLAYLENNIARYDREIEAAVARLERHTMILNPYVRHKTIAKLALEELDKVAPTEPATLRGEADQAELDEYVGKLREFHQQVARQASLSLLLVTESAFMAESYLNLILAFLMRKGVRESTAIRTETLMRKWRAKIERLHLDCAGIPNPANLGDARVGNAKKMFDIRNRVAHSYPDVEEMAVGEMWFHHSFPVLATGQPYMKFGVALHNQLPAADEARFCNRTADALVDFLTDLIDPRIREQVLLAAQANPLGYNHQKNIYSIPFGQAVITTVLARPEAGAAGSAETE
jgi:hypothetical protein